MLDTDGVILLRGGIPVDGLRRAAEACFAARPEGDNQPITSLLEYGCTMQELLAPVGWLEPHIERALGPYTCAVDQSWLRKKRLNNRQDWHQDGGLGVKFPLDRGPMPPMTPLVTCWIPLDACDGSRPGLELIRRPLDHLIHFSELDDAQLRSRFLAQDFWAPCMEPGDILIFCNGVLHRTYLQPDMQHERLSVDYRFFPRTSVVP